MQRCALFAAVSLLGLSLLGNPSWAADTNGPAKPSTQPAAKPSPDVKAKSNQFKQARSKFETDQKVLAQARAKFDVDQKALAQSLRSKNVSEAEIRQQLRAHYEAFRKREMEMEHQILFDLNQQRQQMQNDRERIINAAKEAAKNNHRPKGP